MFEKLAEDRQARAQKLGVNGDDWENIIQGNKTDGPERGGGVGR